MIIKKINKFICLVLTLFYININDTYAISCCAIAGTVATICGSIAGITTFLCGNRGITKCFREEIGFFYKNNNDDGSRITEQDCINRLTSNGEDYCYRKELGDTSKTNPQHITLNQIDSGMEYCCKNFNKAINSVKYTNEHDFAFFKNGTCCIGDCTNIRQDIIKGKYN